MLWYDEENWENPKSDYKNEPSNGKSHSVHHSGNDRGYKASRGRRDGGEDWYVRNNDISEQINIPENCIGLIIGRGGSNIAQIQRDYNVHVNVDRNRAVVKVSGNSLTNVRDALQHIQKQLKSDNRGNSNSQRSYNDHRQKGNQSSFNRRNDRGKDFRNYDNQDNYVNREKNDFYNAPSNSSPPPMINNDEDCIIDWAALNKQAETARAERYAKLPPLTKNFYEESPEVSKMSPQAVEQMRAENNNISVSRVFEKEDQPADIPNPIWKFEQCFERYPDLLEELFKQEFVKPSPIQSQAWPILLKGEDMIGIAQTGTGKTLAFLLPAMIHTEYQSTPRSQRGGPNVLILAPTRELALQIEKEVNKYSFRGMKAVCVYGGGNRREQIDDVKGGVEIIICTPGRLNDLIQAKVIDVASITYLVLDEADRMLDMGFEPQIRKVLIDIRPDRQTVMTSATWPPGVRRLAQSYMNNPIQVCVGSLDLAATHSVEQIIEIVNEDEKYYRIKHFVKNMRRDDKIIVFCGKKVRADDLSSDLTIDGFMCQSIHGSRDQSDREQAIADITSGDVRILIATDVASRGLDIEDITHVINFDFPRNIEEYVHRVGRTGRAGRTGTSISYITREDWGIAKELIEILEEANQTVPDELRNMCTRYQAMKDRRNNEMSAIRGMRGNRGGGGRYRDGY